MGFKETLVKTGARVGLKLKKHSPEILLGAGIISGVAATVMACRATLHADDVLDQHAENMEKIRKAEQIEANDPEKGTEVAIANSKKDTAIVYARTAVGFGKLYAPAALLGVLSVACILSSYGIMKKRNLALTAAYTALDGVYKAYRQRVRDELGDEMDRHFRFNTQKQLVDVETVDEKGKAKTEKVEETIISDGDMPSIYAKWFDESSRCYEKDSSRNLMFLRGMQTTMNEQLKARGHVFLNEVYDALDIPRTPEGAVVGWVLGNGDNYIDFGIYDCNRMSSRDFINGWNRAILLDFNVDGVIYNKI